MGIAGAIAKDVLKGQVGIGKSITGTTTKGYKAVKDSKNTNLVERNKPPKPPPELAKTAFDVARKTYSEMQTLEKRALSQNAKNLAIGTAIGAGVPMALTMGVRGAGKLHNKIQTERIWKKLKKENPSLTRDPKAREHFEVMQKFNPDVASNITTARSFMERMQQTRMVPHEFVGDLVRTHKARHDMGIGRALEDVAGRSVGTGMDYARMVQDNKNTQLSHNLDVDRFQHQKGMDKTKLDYQKLKDDRQFQQQGQHHQERMGLDQERMRYQKDTDKRDFAYRMQSDRAQYQQRKKFHKDRSKTAQLHRKMDEVYEY